MIFSEEKKSYFSGRGEITGGSILGETSSIGNAVIQKKRGLEGPRRSTNILKARALADAWIWQGMSGNGVGMSMARPG
jgi:hypothetical protein